MLGDGRGAAGPDRQRSAALGQSVAPAHQRLYALAHNLWWSWDNDTTSLFRELDPVRWREFDHNPIALLQQIPIETLEERAQQLQLHSRINYAYRRMQEYLNSDRTWGARARRRALGPAGRLLLRRVRPARVAADLLGRPGHPRRRSHQERVGPRHPAGRRRALLRPGLLQAAARSRRLAARRLPRRRQRRCCRSSRRRRDGAPVTVSIETRTGTISARVWSLAVGRNTLLLLDSNVDGNQPEDRELTARLYGGDDRVRIRQELLLGVGGVRALHRDGHLARRRPSQRRAQRVRRARADAPAHGQRGHRRLGGAAPRVARRSSSRRTRRCPPATIGFMPDLVEEHLGTAARIAAHSSYDELMALGPRQRPRITARRSA